MVLRVPADFKATADQSARRFLLVELRMRRGMAIPLHVTPEDSPASTPPPARSPSRSETRSRFLAREGSFIHVPAGTPHGSRVDSETARLLILSTPQHEAFYRAAGEPAPATTLPRAHDPGGQVDIEKITAAAARFGVHIIGPPPS